jgi:adenylate cyclase
MTKSHDVLVAENEAYIREICVAREAQDITAQLVVEQFITVEQILSHLEVAKAQAEAAQKSTEVRNQFIKQVFGRYLSDDVVANLLESPSGLKLGGDRRTVSIMMTDLRGFTALCEQLSAEAVVSMLNTYLEKMTEIIMKHGGTIDEFIGDAILVIFGAPVVHDDDALRAVACAVDMQLAMDGVNRQFREAGHPEVEMGIGINTGEVVVGNIGSTRRAKYGVVGRTVNLTSRIESYSVGSQILISDSTARACGDVLELGRSMEARPKGVDQTITIHEVTGVGGPYDLRLAMLGAPVFSQLTPPLSLAFEVLDGKHSGVETTSGTMVALSEKFAILEAASLPPLYGNLKASVYDAGNGIVTDKLYAKVVDDVPVEGHLCLIRFTSVPDSARQHFDRLLRRVDVAA